MFAANHSSGLVGACDRPVAERSSGAAEGWMESNHQGPASVVDNVSPAIYARAFVGCTCRRLWRAPPLVISEAGGAKRTNPGNNGFAGVDGVGGVGLSQTALSSCFSLNAGDGQVTRC